MQASLITDHSGSNLNFDGFLVNDQLSSTKFEEVEWKNPFESANIALQ